MSTLSDITKLETEVLKKMKLEAKFHYDPEHSENLLFLSPLVLLEDYDLKKGGYKDYGAKKVLGRVIKDILERKDAVLFRVPEVIYLHMGYGKNSKNKKGKMALTAEEGEVWRSYLDLSRFARLTSSGESTFDGLEEEEPMEVSLATEDDTQTHDKSRNFPKNLVPPCNSGLQIHLKGRYVLLFSILLMFFEKKKKKEENRSDSEEAKIGPNKISDFMLFWILPYLLNFNHSKVQEVKKHYERRGGNFLEFVKRSPFDVIYESFAPCSVSDEHRDVVLERYKDYYGTDQLRREYELFKTSDGTPLILVPIRYIIKDMPVTLEDIGKNWREMGDTTLFAEFMNLFIKDRDMQEDFLYYSLKDLKYRQTIDFAVLLPDEETFNELIGPLQRESAEYFVRPSQTGRSLIPPHTALLKYPQKDLTVCFSFFQGIRSDQVASLFRAIGAQYMDHFTLAVLHGLCHNHIDSDFGVGNLCSVFRARKFSFNGTNGEREDDLNFAETIGRFCETEFPETYAQWEETVKEDEAVKKIMQKTIESLEIGPKFIRDSDLTVMYTTKSNSKRLCKAFAAPLASSEEMVKSVVNLNGCLLSKLSQCGRKNNTSVVLAIKDTCDGCKLPHLKPAIKKIITHFLRAVIVAGLPNVYTVEPGEEDRENIECDSSSDEDLDDQVEQTSSNTGQKKGHPSNAELETLSHGIDTKWKSLARRLGFSEPEITGFHKDNEEYIEKCYQMLLVWKQRKASSATKKDLCDALCHYLVGRRDLAEALSCY
ncbi:uncharacterized protein [Montipora capricornis]|uniref:uncharacterized protein isoform X2 n=1 Tax=Montipora capricornis TaxID=246305 RepID=UPI0035F14679